MLSLLICFSTCSCNTTGSVNNNTKKGTISKEELLADAEYIELTTENWKDYIEIKEVEVIEKDAFGEETGRHTTTRMELKKNCYISEDNAIRITFTYDNGIGEYYEMTHDYSFYDGPIYEGRRWDLLAIFEYGVSCEKIKGTILKTNIPDERWNINEDGSKSIDVLIKRGEANDTITIDDSTATYESFFN